MGRAGRVTGLTGVLSLAVAVAAGRSAANADFLGWAATPPMGWNSWDASARPSPRPRPRRRRTSWPSISCPTAGRSWWTSSGTSPARAGILPADAPLVMDEWGRLLPAPNRFPSAADGAGFKPLADYVHGKGLKFGIHLMRGIPRQAVARKLPVKGTSVTRRGHRQQGQHLPLEPGHVRRGHVEARRAGVLRLGLRADRLVGRRLREGRRHQPAVSRPRARDRGHPPRDRPHRPAHRPEPLARRDGARPRPST